MGRDDLSDHWRFSTVNENFSICKSYPETLVVPLGVSDEQLKTVATFRTSGRIPVLCYYHKNGSAIVRSSQPFSGFSGYRMSGRCLEDELLLLSILQANPRAPILHSGTQSSLSLHIYDARPYINAVANAAMGAGWESPKFYQHCTLEFCNVENIHIMRDSLSKVRDACLDVNIDSSGWLMALENSRWLEHIKNMLTVAVQIAREIERGETVLVHCSDGWDRTTQLTSLAELLLDPFYRTITGFEVLIEKEWLSFGHKFNDRIGGFCTKNNKQEDRSPIFLQFLDCVHQLMKWYPCAFQFNQSFLVTIMDQCQSCCFGTFLFNNVQERKTAQLYDKTHSIWEWINTDTSTFKNSFYISDSFTGTLLPNVTQKRLHFWREYYLRWVYENDTVDIKEQVMHHLLQWLSEQKTEQRTLGEIFKHLNLKQEQHPFHNTNL